jgi:DNA-binding winged helix-turn-helix (wHTH) protein
VRNEEEEKVEALDAGADDYVTKPFGKKELLARIRAALRRSPVASTAGPRTFISGDLEIDFEARKIRSGTKSVRLTPKEFDLLRYLVSHAGKPVPHRELLQAVWGPDYGDQATTSASHHTFERDRTEPRQTPIHPYRALDRLPLCRVRRILKSDIDRFPRVPAGVPAGIVSEVWKDGIRTNLILRSVVSDLRLTALEMDGKIALNLHHPQGLPVVWNCVSNRKVVAEIHGGQQHQEAGIYSLEVTECQDWMER